MAILSLFDLKGGIQILRTSTRDIIKVGHRPQTKRVLEVIYGVGIVAGERLINVGYDCLDVRGAVLWHILADWFKVFPEIPGRVLLGDFRKYWRETATE